MEWNTYAYMSPLFQLYGMCMGRAKCLVPIERVPLNYCDQLSNYVQVSYECVPGNSIYCIITIWHVHKAYVALCYILLLYL